MPYLPFGILKDGRKDPQRYHVYFAESDTPFEREHTFSSLAEVREEAKRIMASPIWAALSRHTLQEGLGVTLYKGRGEAASAHVMYRRIFLPPHRWRRMDLIHELAHCVRGLITATHGPQFTSSYLRLLHDCWSPEVAVQLKECFDRRRVRTYEWWEPGRDIPVPDPATLRLSIDEGAEDDLARRKEEGRRAWAKLAPAIRQWHAQLLEEQRARQQGS